jgi:hypothetical protein
MLRINHILLLLILLASHMDSQIIALWLCSFLPAPPQDHEPTISSTISLPICEPISIHLPHTETRQWGPHPSSVSHDNSALPGARISHWGTRFYICTFLPKIIYYLLFIVQTPLFPVITFFVVTFGDLLSFGHTQPMSPLVGALLIFYPCRHRPYLQSTPQVSYLYPLNLFTLSRLWHNLAPVLSSP